MSIVTRAIEKRKSVFYGWWVVAAATFINAFGVGFYFYGWSNFFVPLQAEFGWSRTVLSGLSSLSRLEGGIEGPIVGWLIDRMGSRKMLLIAVTITGLGYVSLSRVSNVWMLYLFFAILAFGYNAGYTHSTSAAVAKWFVKKRSRALSFLNAGNGLGGAIFVPVVAWLIVQYGWRTAAVIVGIAMWVIVIPVAFFFIRDKAEDMGLLPDGDTLGRAVAPGAAAAARAGSVDMEGEVDFTWREALRTRAFWTFTSAMLLRGSILSSIVIHQIPHLTDMGFSRMQASGVLSLMIFFSIPGRLGFGWLGDRVNKKLLLFLLCLLQAAGIFIFIHASNIYLLYLFVIVYGPAYGGVMPLNMALRADLFGRRNFATIAGMITPITAIGGVLGPVFAGYMYDVTHSYSAAFYVFLTLIALSGVMFLFIHKPKPPARVGRSALPARS